MSAQTTGVHMALKRGRACTSPDGLVSCSHREDHGDSDSDYQRFQHNGGSQVNNYFHDFGHV